MTMHGEGWQPIDTAPKGGRRILAWFPRMDDSYHVEWGKNNWEPTENWTLDCGGSATLMYDPPSHWQERAEGPK